MPKNQVSDLITDQEMAFAHLILSGTVTDRQAAEAVGLNPDSAAYTKAKPRVRAYMLEHRAAVHQQLVEQVTDGLRQQNLWRQQVLDRLWEIANLPAEVTRGSISSQVKAISMIVAIEGLIPDRRAGYRNNQSAPTPPEPDIYPAAWLRRQQEESIDPQPGPALVDEEDEPSLAEPEPAGFANRPSSSEPTPSAPSAPDTKVPFSIKKNAFARRR
jgi:hypothetical protein